MQRARSDNCTTTERAATEPRESVDVGDEATHQTDAKDERTARGLRNDHVDDTHVDSSRKRAWGKELESRDLQIQK